MFPACMFASEAELADGRVVCPHCLLIRWNKARRHPPAAKRVAVFERYGGFCYLCGGTATTLDHVIPRSRGGTEAITNLRPCCVSCNSAKGNRLLSEIGLEGKENAGLSSL